MKKERVFVRLFLFGEVVFVVRVFFFFFLPNFKKFYLSQFSLESREFCGHTRS